MDKVETVQCITCKDSAITAMDRLNPDIILCAHEDSSIKTYDLRNSSNVASKTFRGHGSWVSDIKVLSSSQSIFITSSYDHTIKVWDFRSSYPLFNLETHHDKILTTIWNGDN